MVPGKGRNAAIAPIEKRRGRRRRERSWPRHGRRAPAYAAVDLGTNNCRMLVARPIAGGFRVIDSFSRIVRLGEGLASGARLCDDAMRRTVDALKVCAAKLRRRRVRRVRGVTTEACRRAANCGDFLDLVRAETGIPLQSISSDEEARLTLAGSAPLLDGDGPNALVFDIGGGSTEVMWVDMTDGAARLVDLLSLPWGVMTLAELSAGAAAKSGGAHGDALKRMESELGRFDDRHGIRSAVKENRVQMLGTSGTVTTLGALHLDLARYDRARVDGLSLQFERIEAIVARRAGMDAAARAAHPCIGPERAELMNFGCAILQLICRRWPVGSLRVADRGLREGLLLAMMADDGGVRGAPPHSPPVAS